MQLNLHRGKFISVNAYIFRKEGSQQPNLSLQIEEKTNPKKAKARNLKGLKWKLIQQRREKQQRKSMKPNVGS